MSQQMHVNWDMKGHVNDYISEVSFFLCTAKLVCGLFFRQVAISIHVRFIMSCETNCNARVSKFDKPRFEIFHISDEMRVAMTMEEKFPGDGGSFWKFLCESLSLARQQICGRRNFFIHNQQKFEQEKYCGEVFVFRFVAFNFNSWNVLANIKKIILKRASNFLKAELILIVKRFFPHTCALVVKNFYARFRLMKPFILPQRNQSS